MALSGGDRAVSHSCVSRAFAVDVVPPRGLSEQRGAGNQRTSGSSPAYGESRRARGRCGNRGCPRSPGACTIIRTRDILDAFVRPLRDLSSRYRGNHPPFNGCNGRRFHTANRSWPLTARVDDRAILPGWWPTRSEFAAGEFADSGVWQGGIRERIFSWWPHHPSSPLRGLDSWWATNRCV